LDTALHGRAVLTLLYSTCEACKKNVLLPHATKRQKPEAEPVGSSHHSVLHVRHAGNVLIPRPSKRRKPETEPVGSSHHLAAPASHARNAYHVLHGRAVLTLLCSTEMYLMRNALMKVKLGRGGWSGVYL